MNLCQYKDIFGKSNTGLHSYRIPILNIAIVDLSCTILAAIILNKYYFKQINFWYILIILLVIGELLHLLFCVKTPITNLLT